jgi:transposase
LIRGSSCEPYVKRSKSDALDAEGICEAVTRPTMRFVAIKNPEQQAALMLHRTRDLLVRQRTMLVNALRGHLAEYGIIAPQGLASVPKLIALAEKACGTEPLRDSRRLQLLTGWSHDKANTPYSPEVRERAVRMVFEHRDEYTSQYEVILSIAAKIGCSRETLRHWVRQAERDQGLRAGPTSAEQEKIKALEREVRELRQANEILRKASAYFAQAELDRRFKP